MAYKILLMKPQEMKIPRLKSMSTTKISKINDKILPTKINLSINLIYRQNLQTDIKISIIGGYFRW